MANVTDQQWIRLEPWRPKPQPSAKGGPKTRGNRQVFDGIIWLWPTGAGWNHLADRYPSALPAKITAMGRARCLAPNMA